ncbi:MAG: TIGR01777 family oxidoreductase [Candidatus Acidiferrales bacterium]
MKILISGASGMVGAALTKAFRAEGLTVAHLVRPGGAASNGAIRWDPATGTVDASAMEGADAVVNLNGASVAGGRWTPERKAILRASRVDATRALVNALARLRRKPRVLVSASAVGYYGDRSDEILTESSGAGAGFLAELARDWEAEAMRAEASGIRTVLARFGVVLSAEGGALPRMLTPFRMGAGGRLGSGKQWMPWIALEDAIGAIRFVIANAQVSGAVNVVAPNAVRNAEFTRTLAHALRRPAIFPAPAFALRLVLGEMADELLLASQRARPERLLAAGYAFRFDSLDAALHTILAA